MAGRMRTLLGTWAFPSVFIIENGERISVYAYRSDLKEVQDLFPFDCFLQLEGNTVKNYVKV